MTQKYPLRIVLTAGAPLVLGLVEVKESKLEFADEIGRAVENSTQQVAGDGEREPHWKEFDTWLPTRARPTDRAADLQAFENALRFANYATIDDLVYPITRIRVVSRSPYPLGYRLGLRMIGPYPDFQLWDYVNSVPIAPAPLW